MRQSSAIKIAVFFFALGLAAGSVHAGSAMGDAVPKRIVSLSPVLTEELFLLGAGNSIVGRTRYCTKPSGAQKIEVVGNLTELSVEKIVSLQPDLVLAILLTDPRAKQKISALGIRVEEFPDAADFKGACDSFLRLARIVHKEEEAALLVRKAQKEVDGIRRKAADEVSPSVFVEVGADPLVTMTKGSYFHDLITFSGGINIAGDATRQLYSREKVLAQDPDVIIIVSMGFDGEKEKKAWQSYRDLKAARQGRIFMVDSDLFCAPTPLSFVEALKKIEKILHEKRAA